MENIKKNNIFRHKFNLRIVEGWTRKVKWGLEREEEGKGRSTGRDNSNQGTFERACGNPIQ